MLCLEREMLEQDATPSNLPESWSAYLLDERLRRFLQIPPLFEELTDQELEDFYSVTEIVSKPTDTLEAAGEKAAITPSPGLALVPFADLEVCLEPTDSEDVNVEVSVHDKATSKSESAKVKFRFDELQKLHIALEEAYVQEVMYLREESPTRQQNPQRMAAGRRESLQEIGVQLFDNVFSDDAVRDHFLNGLNRERVRITLDARSPELATLPWECLYLAELRVFLASTLKFSLVRYVDEARELAPRSLVPPLRILAALANPGDAPLLAVEKEAKVLRQTLAQAEQDGQVQLRVRPTATTEEIRRDLRVFKPHIFHFVGHGMVHNNVGHLLFVNERNEADLFSAHKLGTVLRDHNVNLAVLNSCETGLTGTENVISGVAQAIVREGVPAAVATIRPVLDAAALMFTREFYRAFVDGYPVEGALVESRKALSLKEWDWSAYTLFSGTRKLEDLRLVSSGRTSEQSH